jgi:hypothetical protein
MDLLDALLPLLANDARDDGKLHLTLSSLVDCFEQADGPTS